MFIGITLFSMFFGAGNLIFAPWLGAQAGTAAPLALLGFLCTSVVLPISAVVIISRYGNARTMLSTIHPVFAHLFMALVYLLIGPCIAIPRTASTSYEMFGWLLPDTLLCRIVYTCVFFALCALTARRPGKLKDILGKIMGPILVVLVLLLTGYGLIRQGTLPVSGPAPAYESHAFVSGFVDGYQTMDILAAFCFGIIILMNIASAGITEPDQQRSLLRKAAVIAGILLGSLYALLAMTGMKYAADFTDLSNGAQILSSLADMEFGSFGSVLISVIFLAACYNVCSGLLSCCSEFFYEVTGKMSYSAWLLLFTAAGIVVAIGGLDFILAFSSPILSLICPVAVLLLLWGLIYPWIHSSAKKEHSAS